MGLRRGATAAILMSTAGLWVSCLTTPRQEESVIVLHTGAARNVTRLTQTPEDETNAVVSPDGSSLAFQVFKNGQYDLWTLDPKTGRNLVQVTNHSANDVEPAWYSDNKSIVFCSDRLGSYSLWRQKASGSGGTTMITRGGDMIDTQPAVSPDGSRIVYTSRPRVPDEEVRVETVDALIRIIKRPLSIWMVDPSGSNLTQFGEGVKPVWSPDAKRIAFSSNISGNWDVWAMNADGSGQTQLTTDVKDQHSAAYSPDGTWVVYVSNQSGNPDLWIMKADGSSWTQLTTDRSDELSPSWASDGNIYFTSNKSRNSDIWRLTPVLPE